MELKSECATKMESMKAEEMRLIYKGKILKDEQTLDSYKIIDGMTVHLVKGKSAGGAKPADTTTTEASSSSELGAGAGAGLGGAGLGAGAGAQPNPFGGMGGMGGGMPPGGFGGMGGNPYGGMGAGGMGGNPYGGMGGGMGGQPGQMPNPQMMQ